MRERIVNRLLAWGLFAALVAAVAFAANLKDVKILDSSGADGDSVKIWRDSSDNMKFRDGSNALLKLSDFYTSASTISQANLDPTNLTATNLTATSATITTLTATAANVSGDATVGGDLDVTGTVTYGSFSLGDEIGFTTVTATYTSATDSLIENDLEVQGATTLGGDLTVTGDISASTVTATNLSGALATSDLTGTLTDAQIDNDITIASTSNISTSGNLTVGNDANVSGTLTVDGSIAGNAATLTDVTADSFTGTTVTATTFFGDGSQLSGIHSGALLYSLTDTESTVANDYMLLTTAEVGDASTTSTEITAATTQTVARWITSDLGILSLQPSVAELSLYAARTAGTKDTLLYYRLWERTSTGVETLISTSENIGTPLTGDIVNYDIDAIIPRTTFDIDDEIVLEIIASIESGGTDPTVTIYMEGAATSSFLHLSVPSNQLVPYKGASRDVTLGSYDLTATDVTASGDVTVGGDATISGDLITTTIHEVSETSLVLSLDFEPHSKIESVVGRFDPSVTYDASEYRNDGTITGAAVAAGFNGGQALDFDGSSDYVSAADDFPVSDAYTLNIWMKRPTDPAATEVMLNLSDDITGAMYMYLSILGTTDLPYIKRYQDATHVVQISGTTVLDDNNWHMVTGVFETSSVTLYVDGVQENQNVSVTFDDHDWNIAGVAALVRTSVSGHYEGLLDDPRIWARALSASEVAALYHQRATPPAPRLHRKTRNIHNILAEEIDTPTTYTSYDVSGLDLLVFTNAGTTDADDVYLELHGLAGGVDGQRLTILNSNQDVNVQYIWLRTSTGTQEFYFSDTRLNNRQTEPTPRHAVDLLCYNGVWHHIDSKD